jgi:hypothetical protein
MTRADCRQKSYGDLGCSYVSYSLIFLCSSGHDELYSCNLSVHSSNCFALLLNMRSLLLFSLLLAVLSLIGADSSSTAAESSAGTSNPATLDTSSSSVPATLPPSPSPSPAPSSSSPSVKNWVNFAPHQLPEIVPYQTGAVWSINITWATDKQLPLTITADILEFGGGFWYGKAEGNITAQTGWQIFTVTNEFELHNGGKQLMKLSMHYPWVKTTNYIALAPMIYIEGGDSITYGDGLSAAPHTKSISVLTLVATAMLAILFL